MIIRSLTLLVSCLLLLSGCGSAEFYRAMQKGYELQLAQYNADQQRKKDQADKPLVNFSWTDLDGITHSMVVNLPPGYGGGQENPMPVLNLPSPWDVPLRIFDRSLTAAERLLPTFAAWGDRNETTDTTSISTGDNSYLMMTPGQGSYIDFTKDWTYSNDNHSVQEETE